MLYLVSYDELSDGVRKIKISKDEFMKIYLELLREGRSEYNGETIVFTDSLVNKNLDLENIKELQAPLTKVL